MMNIQKLYEIKNVNVLVYGDFMIDKYINGNVNRISPEAPVPVIEIVEKKSKLGGAGNVINNIIALGANVRVLGYIGDDADGNFLLKSFNKTQVETTYMKKYKEIQTISKTRIVSKNQQFLRLDEERMEEPPKDYYEFLKENKNKIFQSISSLVISDYKKGAVNKKISQFLIREANQRNIPIIVDPKGTDYSKYNGATVCTPNVKEMSLVIGKDLNNEEIIKKEGIGLSNKIHLKYLMLTRSEKGISLIDAKNKSKNDFPTMVKEVIDVTGAGDTVVATVAVMLPLHFSILEICKLCNVTASIVVSKFGTSTATFNELIYNLEKENGDYKLVSLEKAKEISENLRKNGKKIVFTNGCFDLLHVGHVSSFKKAKEFGDVLIVAVNSDQSVKKNKGDLRPIINQEDRIAMISELECVDYVILMNDKDPSKLIKLLKPDFTVKGQDWKDKYMPEKEIVESYGGEIKFIELNKGKSTTNIINKVLEAYKNE